MRALRIAALVAAAVGALPCLASSAVVSARPWFEPAAAATGGFVHRAGDFQIRLEPRAAVTMTSPSGARARLILEGADPFVRPEGLSPLPGHTNFLLGNAPAAWRTNVAQFAQVRYSGVYPGIDLIFYGGPSELEFDFIVAPGADAARIRLRLEGVPHAAIDASGDLVLPTSGGEFRHRSPSLYQTDANGRQIVAGSFIRHANGEFGFHTGTYDHSRPLIIDPILFYKDVGGTGSDVGRASAIDAQGNVYIFGGSGSADFPTTAGSVQKSSGGSTDLFLLKFNATGDVLFSTYLGGSGIEGAGGIEVDKDGNVYLTGSTSSPNFPVSADALQRTSGGATDAYLVKLDPTGSKLLYSSYLGGSVNEVGNALVLDNASNVYIAGWTGSSDFPAKRVGGAPAQAKFGGGADDIFVAKFSLSPPALIYSTFLGGSGVDEATTLAVDPITGVASIGGSTTSVNFPVTANPIQPALHGSRDGFLARVNATGSAFAFVTYLGGAADDIVNAIALNAQGALYATGNTTSTDFVTTAGVMQRSNAGKTDIFITRLSPAGVLEQSTYLGGANDDSVTTIAVNAAGTVVLGAVLTADVQITPQSDETLSKARSTSAPRNSSGDPFTLLVHSNAELSRIIAEYEFAPNSIPQGNQKISGCRVVGNTTCCTGSIYGAGQTPAKRRCAILCMDNELITTSDLPPGDPNLSGNRGYYGDPISTETGEITASAVDLTPRGPGLLGFSRTYASFLQVRGISGAMGANWMHGYELRLALTDTTATVTLTGGKTIRFSRSGSTFTLAGPSPTVFQLIASGSEFKFMNPRVRLSLTFNSAGQLTRIEDRNGNGVTITQSAQGPVSAADGLGRTLAFTYASGKLARVADETGRTVNFTYSGEELVAVADFASRTTTYAYAARDKRPTLLTAITLPAGNQPQVQDFDDQGRAISQKDPANAASTVAFAASGSATVTGPLGETFTHKHENGKLIRTTDPAGLVSSFTYDANLRQTSYTDRAGQVRKATYHEPTGLLLTSTDALGNTVGNSYTAQDQGGLTFYNLTAVQYADGSISAMTYDVRGNLLTVTDGANQKWVYTYNSRGQILTAANPAGGTVTRTYADDGMLTSVQDGSGNGTTYAYDDAKRLNRVTFPDGAYNDLLYNKADLVIATTNQDGVSVQGSFDDNGLPLATTSPEGATRSVTRDAAGRITSTADRMGRQTSYEYDAAGRLAAAISPAGRRLTATRDASGRILSTASPDHMLATRTYDKEGRVVSITDGMDRKWTYARDALGRLTRVAGPAGSTYQLEYDARSRLTAFTDPLGRASRFAYDARGALVTSTAPSGDTLQFTVGALGLPTRFTDPNGKAWKTAYTASGLTASVSDPLNRQTDYEYDVHRRIAKVTSGGGTAALSYDSAGHLVQREYSDGARLVYSWTPNGLLSAATGAALTYNAGGQITTSNGLGIGRDEEGRIASITYAPDKAVTYAYNAAGQLADVNDWAGGKLAFQYDASGLLTAVNRSNGVTTKYGYDAAAVLTAITDENDSPISSISLTRDAAGQVVAADRSTPTAPAPVAASARWTYDDASQIAEASYDAQGNLTAESGRSLNWDLAGRLTSFSSGDASVNYSYDGLKMLTGRSGAGSTRSFVVNYALALPSIAALREGDTDKTYYVYTPGGRLLYAIDAESSARGFYHFDEAGNTTFLTGDAGAVTDSYAITPFGESVAHTGPTDNPFTFQGSFGVFHDAAAGLFFLRNRVYDGRTARFLSPDALLSPGEARSANPYQYALLNPLSNSDPTGLLTHSEVDSLLQYSVASRIFGAILANDIGQLAARSGYGNTRSVERLVDGLLQQIVGRSQLAIDYGRSGDIYSLLAANLRANAGWIADQIINPASPDAAFFHDAISTVVQADADLHGSDGGRVVDGYSRTLTTNYLDSVVRWARGRNPVPASGQGQVNGAGSSAAAAGSASSAAGAGLIANLSPAYLAGLQGNPLITNDGGTLITNDGGTLITNDGGTLITNDGGTLIANDGGTLVATGGGN